MSATLHALPRENTAFAPDNAAIAESLRILAGQVERGEWGDVDTIVSLVEHEGGRIARQTFGKPLDMARVTGLLFFGAQAAARGEP